MPRFDEAGRRRRRRRSSAAQQAALLDALAASGLGPIAFCRQHGLSRVTFARWRRAVTPLPGFAVVQVRSSRAEPWRARPRPSLTLTLRWPSGPAAEFTGLDGATLATLVRTLDDLAREHAGTVDPR
jgi:hypothetical protein